MTKSELAELSKQFEHDVREYGEEACKKWSGSVCKKQFQPKFKQQNFCCLKCSGESKRKDNDTR